MTHAEIYQNLIGCFSAVFLRLSYVLLRGKRKNGRGMQRVLRRVNGLGFMFSPGVTFC